MSEISSLAEIHPDARIGQNTRIAPFCVIEQDVEIGEGCQIGPHVTIMNGARIGNYVRIFPGAVISAEPQDLKYQGEYTLTYIGDYTTIRECCTINKGTAASGKTIVGSHCLLMAYVHVAHDCVLGNHCILANNATLAGHIIIDDFATIGGLVAIHQFVRIGRHAMVGGGSLVRKDVPPYVIVSREPLQYEGVNKIGLSRRGFTPDQIAHITEIYWVLYVKGLTISTALDEIHATWPESEVAAEVTTFVHSSSRGLTKGMQKGRNQASKED
jgi:UDP-N-acetylglucosamine acyltransferase